MLIRVGSFKMHQLETIDIPQIENGEYFHTGTPTCSASHCHVKKDVFKSTNFDGGTIFCCISLILIFMILFLLQILAWRIFDVDIFPVDDSVSNHQMSNTSIHRLSFNDE